MKVLIELPDSEYNNLLTRLNNVDETLTPTEVAVTIGTPLNGTNGEVLMKMFPPSVYFPSNGTYMALLTKDCLVSCSNMDWWNTEYGKEQE